jgi:DNA repair and recombination protein RAD52
MFSPEQIEQMRAPLGSDRISHRRQAGKELNYIESWDAIATANRILGYDGWSYTVDRLEPHGEVWIALVTVIVHGPQGGSISRQDVGVGIPAGGSKEAMETAIKGAVSDAQKRALRTLGDQWGLGLYDKDADHGSQDVGQQRTEQRQERKQQQEPPDLTVIQAGVWDRLKRDWQAAKVPKEKVEADAKAYLHDVLHLEHWGQLNPAQWREFEAVLHADITGEEPGAPRQCPACGAEMVERSGEKNGRAWRALMCQAKCGASPVWLN